MHLVVKFLPNCASVDMDYTINNMQFSMTFLIRFSANVHSMGNKKIVIEMNCDNHNSIILYNRLSIRIFVK